MILETFLKTYYNLPSNNLHITFLDLIIMKINFPKYQSNLKKLSNLNYIEQKILNIELDDKRYLLYLLSQTHFSNYISDLKTYIDGMISENITELNQILLNRLYSKIIFIENLDKIIIDIFEKLLTKNYPLSDKYNLIKFYNRDLIDKFIESIQITKPYTNNKIIDELYDSLYNSSIRLIRYLKNIKISNSKKYGLSNFDPELYMFFLKYYVGLNLTNTKQIDYIYKWAYNYLKYNIKITNNIINKIDLSNQSFKSKDEMIQLYQYKLDELSNIVKSYNIPNTTKCILKTYSNKDSSGAKYFNNCFYLNTYNWKNEKKYEIRSLVMHEAYPGHHMQIDLFNNFHKNKYLFTIYNEYTTSFAEGWGLFSEKIHSFNNLIDDYGQYQMDRLRILRIIADTDLHYYNRSPQYVIDKLSKYLSNNIVSEVYRYLVLPGQAVSYKIGETVFMSIYKQFNQKINSKFMYEIYKNILLNSSPFLDDLLKEYNMKFFYL